MTELDSTNCFGFKKNHLQVLQKGNKPIMNEQLYFQKRDWRNTP